MAFWKAPNVCTAGAGNFRASHQPLKFYLYNFQDLSSSIISSLGSCGVCGRFSVTDRLELSYMWTCCGSALEKSIVPSTTDGRHRSEICQICFIFQWYCITSIIKIWDFVKNVNICLRQLSSTKFVNMIDLFASLGLLTTYWLLFSRRSSCHADWIRPNGLQVQAEAALYAWFCIRAFILLLKCLPCLLNWRSKSLDKHWFQPVLIVHLQPG